MKPSVLWMAKLRGANGPAIGEQPPVVVSAELLGGGEGLELLVGFTRLGNLLAMLDRQEVSEVQKHLVWVGRSSLVE
jgi:hypothetical protein